MKNLLLSTYLAVSLGLSSFAQPGLIFKDDAEDAPPVPDPWGNVSKRTAWRVTTGGNQNPNNYLSQNYIQVTGAGGGNPTPFRGTGCYKFHMERRGDLFGGPNNDLQGQLQHLRNEFGWGQNCTEFTNLRWTIVSIFLPANFCDDNVPMQIAYDMKFGDAVGPASLSLWVEGGQYIIQQLNTQYSGATVDVQATLPAPHNTVNKGVWVTWVVERNFKNDNTGFVRIYKKVNGVHSTLQLVYSHTGPNYNMQCGSQSEAYLQMGLYKWPWVNDNEQGEGTATACGHDPIDAWYDEYYFLDATASLADVNALVSGGSAPTNLAPAVNAGTNQTLTSPTSTASLVGTATDADGTIEGTIWTKVSGPTGGAIANAGLLSTTVSGLVLGTYVYRLTATDDDGASTLDEVSITVQTAPVVAAPVFTDATCVETTGTDNGAADCPSVPIPDRTVLLPRATDSFQVTAVHKNGGGHIQSFAIAQIGTTPSVVTPVQFNQNGWISTKTNFSVAGLIAGTYTYQITVTDNAANIKRDTMQIIVVASANLAPAVNAGSDVKITIDDYGPFPTRNAGLIGTATDADGIASVEWIKIAGAENITMSAPNSLSNTISGLVAGNYTFRLIATDGLGKTSFDDVTINVLSVNAGEDATVIAPNATYNLQGAAAFVSDTTSVTWTQVSGPTTATMSQNRKLNNVLGNLTLGVYTFNLKVVYNTGQEARSNIILTVLEGTIKQYNIGVDIKD